MSILMNKKLMISLAAGAVMIPSLAFAQATTATGAVGGAVVGGAVGGPVGAVVGGAVGATVGAAVEPPREVITYIEKDTSPMVTVEERVVVGEPLPAKVEIRTVPSHPEWRYAYVNNHRVIVEPKTRKVIKVIN